MRKYFKLLWIIPILLVIFISFKNYKFIKMYYNYIEKNNVDLSFSIFTKTIANDTFFSIPLGERIVQEGFKADDVLTWHEGLEFTNDRWLFNVIVFFIYKAFGIDGIANFVTICSLAIGILLFFVMKDRTKSMPLAIFGMLFAMYFSRNVFQARAQILSFPLFILEFWAIEKLVETGKKRYVISLFIISVLLANVHTSVYPICLIMYLPYIAEWIFNKNINRIKKIDKETIVNIKYFFIAFALSLIAGMISPTGVTTYTTFFKAILYTDTSFIGECQPSNIHNNLPLFILLLIALLLIIMPKVKIKIRDLCLILGFGFMSLLAFRSSFFFFFISFVSILRLIKELIKNYRLGLNSNFLRYALYASFIVLLSSFYLKNFWYIQGDSYIPKDLYPVDATNFILKNLDYENMRIFNSFNYGSYLEFRGIKAFIDSRSGMYTEEFNPGCTVLEDWLKINEDSSNYEKIFNKYKITHVLVQGVNEKLEEDEKYNKIYTDKYFSLYEKEED